MLYLNVTDFSLISPSSQEVSIELLMKACTWLKLREAVHAQKEQFKDLMQCMQFIGKLLHKQMTNECHKMSH